MFWRKKQVDRSHSIKLKKEQMAKLATIADSYNLDTNECITRLIDGFFNNPHTDVGKNVQQTLATGQAAQAQSALNENPLFQFYQQLPPEMQQEIMQRVMGAFMGGNKTSPGF